MYLAGTHVLSMCILMGLVIIISFSEKHLYNKALKTGETGEKLLSSSVEFANI